jgi:hypothetical protein
MDQYPSTGIECQGLEAPVALVKRLAIPALISLCLLVLTSCWNGRVLFSFEQPFWASLDGGPRLASSLAAASLTHGYLPRFLLSTQTASPADQLSAALKGRTFHAVVVGPLLSLDWNAYAPQHPRTVFVLVGAAAPVNPPPNVLALFYDRRSAFRAAGTAAGVSVRGGSAGPGAGALAARIAVLLSAAPSLDDGETESFAQGVAQALDGARPVVRVLGEHVDRATLKTAIEEMHRQGVQVFLLGMGSLDAWALEVLQGSGGSAVVADWASSGAFPAQVFLSVEEDIPGGIARALARVGRVSSVRGPVRLVSGRAGPPARETARFRESE